ncbi:MAG: bifunctional DNA primase/helicase, partial [Moorea sp. SIO2B7]|nr:bifunctional DNA primase/helicase [Moorena sp. SIO2B7]
SDSLVIIDEVEQVIWHGLNSSTCQGNRAAILKSLKTLMENVLGGEGQVFVADADLSDTSLDYLLALAGIQQQPFLIQNDWKPGLSESWQIHNYTESTPKKLVKDLENHIREGGKPMVCLSAQKVKSKWGTCTLEAYLQKQFPKLKILRIDSESLADKNHPAQGCITKLNEILGNYDIVLASPSIETGVSIDIHGHFTSVWCIAQGVQSAHSVCQSLGRIRENLPRYIWVAPYGFNKVGNGSTSISSLLTSGKRLTQLNIRLLQQADFEALDDLDTGFQGESLLCWAKMAVRVNVSMVNYRESVLALLQEEGHRFVEVKSLKPTAKIKENNSAKKNNQLLAAINAVRDENLRTECEAISKAKNLTNAEYKRLKKRLVKSLTERRALRKHDLEIRYGIPVTPKLVFKDDEGWYKKLRLHYFLTVGREYLPKRDAMMARRLILQGEGSIFIPDFNGSQLGAMIATMEIIGIPVLLDDSKRELRNTDEDLQAMAAIALANRYSIKTVMGIGLASNSTPIIIVRRFLAQIGYSLLCIRRETCDKKQVRVYQVVNPEDGRDEVFKQWLTVDSQDFLCNDSWENYREENQEAKILSTPEESDYIQLSLDI